MRQTIYISDFETSTGNKDNSTNVYLWGLSSLDRTKRYKGVNLFDFFTVSEHFNVRRVYFHNLSFDGKFIVHHLMTEGYNFISNSNREGRRQKLKPGEFRWLANDLGKIYQIEVTTFEGHPMKFSDTLLLMPSSVKKLGETLSSDSDVKMMKGEIDYDLYKSFNHINEVPKELLDYLWMDIDIVVETFKKFKESYKSHTMTSAGTAMKSFKEHYGQLDYVKDFGGTYRTRAGKPDITVNLLTEEQWWEFKEGYKGGFTVGNQKYKNVFMSGFNGESVDINSMYPAIMKDMLLPYGMPLSYKPSGDYLTLYKIFIIETWKTDPDMPSHLHNPKAKHLTKVKYLDECAGEFFTYTDFELEELKKTYQLVEDINYTVIKTTYFRAKKVFTSWVEMMSHLKINAKTEAERLYHKTILNALYGKTGESPLKGGRDIVYDPEHKLPGTRYGDKEQFVEQKTVSEMDYLSYVPMALFITAYARTKLIRAIRLNKDIFLYADTDSMYLMGKSKGLEIHDTKFGAWKPEIRFTAFKWIKPKAYLAQMTAEYKFGEWHSKDKIKRAIAGLSTENHKMVTWDNFTLGTKIKNGKRQKKNVKGGLILVDRDYSL